MTIKLTKAAEENYKKLPLNIQKKPVPSNACDKIN